MNYIRHLTGFYDRIQQDDRLNPTHISLYLALFQFWNLNHFQNPISISRNEMMRLSKISALGTYHKCIKQLQEFGYIEYIPSFNPYKGSLVNLHNFENSEIQNLNKKRIKKQTTSEQVLNSHHIKIDTGIEQALIPSINRLNNTNNKTLVKPQRNILVKLVSVNSLDQKNEKQLEASASNSIIATGAMNLPKLQYAKPGAKIPPEFYEVQLFFEEKEVTKVEAEKFFNHYASNGWLVGGKAKMKDWHAAARNWLLNSKKFNSSNNISFGRSLSTIRSSVNGVQEGKPNHLNATTQKSYQDKL